MAIVKRPLLSGDARGQIGKSLVFLGWKGIQTARSYVVPANPKSVLQTSQRTVFKSAVEDYHSALFNAVDNEGLKLITSLQSSPMSQFNFFVKKYTLLTNDSKTPAIVSVNSITEDASNYIVTLYISENVAGSLYWGYNSRVLIDEITFTPQQLFPSVGIYKYSAAINVPKVDVGDVSAFFFKIIDPVSDVFISGVYKVALPLPTP